MDWPPGQRLGCLTPRVLPPHPDLRAQPPTVPQLQGHPSLTHHTPLSHTRPPESLTPNCPGALTTLCQPLFERADAPPRFDLGSCTSSGQMVLQHRTLLGQGAFGVALLLQVNPLGGGPSFAAAGKINLVGTSPLHSVHGCAAGVCAPMSCALVSLTQTCLRAASGRLGPPASTAASDALTPTGAIRMHQLGMSSRSTALCAGSLVWRRHQPES
jgi:hypothetical protein